MAKNYFRIFDWMFNLGLEQGELIVFAFLCENACDEFSQYEIAQHTGITMHDVLTYAGWLNSLYYCQMELRKDNLGESQYYFKMTLDDLNYARKQADGFFNE